jgi:hypothetical protein
MWQRETVRLGWTDHAVRLSGLFPENKVGLIAAATDLNPNDLHRLHIVSRDADRVRELAARKPDNEEYWSLRKANFAWRLMHGRYHDHLARQNRQQLSLHRFREQILDPLNGA